MSNKLMRLLTVMILMMFSMGVDAKIKVDLGGEKNDGVYPGGTIVEKSQTEANASGLVTVTITVTPNKGFTIQQSDLVVVSTYSPDGSDTRSPKIAAELTLLGTDPKDPSEPRDYTFIVGSSLGAWVKEANFHSNGAKGGGNRSTGTLITSLSQITDEAGTYVITSDIDVPSSFETIASFSGTLTAQAKEDGTFPVITGLRVPIFATATNATISNLMFKSISVSGSGPIGAVCGTADGTTRIYNCGILPTLTITGITYDTTDGHITGFGSTVSSDDGNCGSLVGTLAGNARVINCFSYANITGGTTVAGIVGNNTTTSITQSTVGTVGMVVNCMFYGDITGGTTKRPVYGGNMIINNATNGVNPYCYYRANASFDDSYNAIDNYNRSWPADEEYLTRFEYYRSILNSNKRLCTYWVTDKAYGSENAPTDADEALIAKWVLDPAIAPYPILKKWDKYPSIINPKKSQTIDPRLIVKGANGNYNFQTPQWTNRSTANPYEGKSYTSSLTVTVTPGIHAPEGIDSKEISLTITDMDTLNYDYGYYKVQLPYYNEVFGDPAVQIPATTAADYATKWNSRYAGNYKDYVVTGWKITDITGGVANVTDLAGTDANGNAFDHTFTPNWESGYNFADRYCTTKDKYSNTNPRVFAQGGFFYVPEGVTSINIEAYWGKAFYLHNTGHYIDRVNITNQTADGNRKLGDPFTSAGILPNTFQEKNVYDDWEVAIKALDVATESSGKLSLTVYDQALVLLSNFQVRNENGKIGKDVDSKWHPYTLMSADLDMDNEPDYCFEFQFRKEYTRPGIQPIRFDFLPVPELGMAVRHNEQQNTIGIFIPQGHFEITETAFMHTTQFEYDSNIGKIESPVILNGGNFEQIVVRYGSTSNTGPANKTSYFLLGGHFRLLRFTPGAHANTGNTARVRLCAVNAIGGEYPEFYLSGIYRPDITLSGTQIAAQGNPHCYINGGKFNLIAGAGYDKVYGNITFKIDHAYIGEFYGGGINGSNYVGGNIDVTIDHSFVTKYCGGPKVGKMVEGKTVTTNATGTKFIQYYGGGNGGTSYYRWKRQDGNAAMPASTADGWKNYGYGTFNPLNSQLNNNKQYEGPETDLNRGYNALFEFECFVESNGIGANPTLRSYMHWAQFGTTSTGNITNNLTDCIFENNFYGGGNLANVSGNVTSTLTNCTVNGNAFGGGYSGKIEPFRIHDRTKTEFPYIDKAGIMHNGALYYVKDGNDDRYYTWCYKDPTTGKMYPEGVTIPNTATTDNPTFQDKGKWYVLTTVSLEGLGAVSGNATLTLNGSTTGSTSVGGSVFGGGAESTVSGNTIVTLKGNTQVSGNVFGGGDNGIVTGSATVNIE
jgi:hypothetical protein